EPPALALPGDIDVDALAIERGDARRAAEPQLDLRVGQLAAQPTCKLAGIERKLADGKHALDRSGGEQPLDLVRRRLADRADGLAERSELVGTDARSAGDGIVFLQAMHHLVGVVGDEAIEVAARPQCSRARSRVVITVMDPRLVDERCAPQDVVLALGDDDPRKAEPLQFQRGFAAVEAAADHDGVGYCAARYGSRHGWRTILTAPLTSSAVSEAPSSCRRTFGQETSTA